MAGGGRQKAQGVLVFENAVFLIYILLFAKPMFRVQHVGCQGLVARFHFCCSLIPIFEVTFSSPRNGQSLGVQGLGQP